MIKLSAQSMPLDSRLTALYTNLDVAGRPVSEFNVVRGNLAAL